MDTTQMLKGVLDVAVLAVLDREDGYGYDVVRRLRAAGLDEVGDARSTARCAGCTRPARSRRTSCRPTRGRTASTTGSTRRGRRRWPTRPRPGWPSPTPWAACWPARPTRRDDDDHGRDQDQRGDPQPGGPGVPGRRRGRGSPTCRTRTGPTCSTSSPRTSTSLPPRATGRSRPGSARRPSTPPSCGRRPGLPPVQARGRAGGRLVARLGAAAGAARSRRPGVPRLVGPVWWLSRLGPRRAGGDVARPEHPDMGRRHAVHAAGRVAGGRACSSSSWPCGLGAARPPGHGRARRSPSTPSAWCGPRGHPLVPSCVGRREHVVYSRKSYIPPAKARPDRGRVRGGGQVWNLYAYDARANSSTTSGCTTRTARRSRSDLSRDVTRQAGRRRAGPAGRERLPVPVVEPDGTVGTRTQDRRSTPRRWSWSLPRLQPARAVGPTASQGPSDGKR